MDNRSGLSRFQDLVVWQKAHQLVIDLYRLTSGLPRTELFGLVSQVRRAAVSVPANIAEGFKKRSILDKARFYNIAQGSLEEARYYMILVEDLGFAKDTKQYQERIEEIGKMLGGLIRALGRPARTEKE